MVPEFERHILGDPKYSKEDIEPKWEDNHHTDWEGHTTLTLAGLKAIVDHLYERFSGKTTFLLGVGGGLDPADQLPIHITGHGVAADEDGKISLFLSCERGEILFHLLREKAMSLKGADANTPEGS